MGTCALAAQSPLLSDPCVGVSLDFQRTRTFIPVLAVILAWPTEPALGVREAAAEAAPAIAALKQGRILRPIRLRTPSSDHDRSHFDYDDLLDDYEDEEPRGLPYVLALTGHLPYATATLTIIGHLGPAPRWLVSVRTPPVRLQC